MGKRKRGFTLNEHQEMGKRLSGIEEEVHNIYRQFVVDYPLAGPEVRTVRRIGRDVIKLRLSMENALFREHPAAAQISTYSPSSTAHGFG